MPDQHYIRSYGAAFVWTLDAIQPTVLGIVYWIAGLWSLLGSVLACVWVNFSVPIYCNRSTYGSRYKHDRQNKVRTEDDPTSDVRDFEAECDQNHLRIVQNSVPYEGHDNIACCTRADDSYCLEDREEQNYRVEEQGKPGICRTPESAWEKDGR